MKFFSLHFYAYVSDRHKA